MTTAALDEPDVHRPADYAARAQPRTARDRPRREAPADDRERDDIEPFRAVTHPDEVATGSNRPDVPLGGGPRLRLVLGSAPGITRGTDSFGRARPNPDERPDLAIMDNPRRRQVRRPTIRAVTEGAMRAMTGHFETLAQSFTKTFVVMLEAASARAASLDFVSGLPCKTQPMPL